jgi:xylulokinase
MYLIGYDIGSSSVKASIVDAESGRCMASAFYPKKEMEIRSVKPGWAEQHPDCWWDNLKAATSAILSESRVKPSGVKGIGISYQMHGLVVINKNHQALRPSIIWCDSRAVSYGEKAFTDIGSDQCLSHLLNSPGNFTASKLKWVKENEADIYRQIYKIMLPGDYIAMRLTGNICTTASGLSEGIMWDFKNDAVASFLLGYYGFGRELIPDILPTFSNQGELTTEAADELQLVKGIPVTYRAGDQPNNAFSLNVLNPGEIAATAGTSGVVYGVSSDIKYDPQSRVNAFAHVNHTKADARLGVLLCINGTGILNSWVKNNTGFTDSSYEAMNGAASDIAPGSNGLTVLPFGNGSERILNNKNIECSMHNINFNVHSNKHILRASQEGVAFAFRYGMDIMKDIGISPAVIRAGKANMFLSPIFRNTLSTITGATIELYNTDGSQGAARGAGIGAGIYKTFNEAFSGLKILETVHPKKEMATPCMEAYERWKKALITALS